MFVHTYVGIYECMYIGMHACTFNFFLIIINIFSLIHKRQINMKLKILQ